MTATAQPTDAELRELLGRPRTWAVVGCSPTPSRDSHRIAAMLQARGNRIVPITPRASVILGERCYPSLAEAAASPEVGRIDVVDVFRRSELAGVHVDEAIAIGAPVVWMQLGVIDEDAAARGRAAGLRVIMDRCPAIELSRLAI